MGETNQEPSMEDILASIKRVIAEDHRPSAMAAPPRATRNRRSEPEAEEPRSEDLDDDVLDLHDPLAEGDGLISPDLAAASRQSLAQLAAMREEKEVEPDLLVGEGPLEAVVRDMLRPLLKQWLEQRLPDMVEDMVGREIARITGKGL